MNLADAVEQLLTRSRPGALLAMLARMPIPVLTPERFADAAPEQGLADPSSSPLVELVEPRPFVPGKLDGDVVIKDQIDVAGLRTGIGLASGGELATHDAELVRRIAAAGGRIIGKAKMTELGMDGLGTLMHYDMPRNPVAPGYVPGGSSTGTAVAVASGLARYGVGGDGLGSIRIPAAFCGLVGLKPTRTRVPRDGIRSPVRSLDAVGPITHTVDDCARLWQVMAGEPVTAVEPWMPARIGVPSLEGPLRVARVIAAAFHRMLAALGIPTEPIELPELARSTLLGALTGAYELSTGALGPQTQTRAGRMSLALGRAFSASSVARLQRQRDDVKTATARVLERTPILAMPTTAIPPPALSSALLANHHPPFMLRALGAFTPLANVVDLPAIAVPSGVDERGRPLSIMFVAAPGEETALLRLALAAEQLGLGTQRI